MPEPKKIIEAALFMSPGAVSTRELSTICGRNLAEVRVALNELMHEYAERDGALEIREDEKGFRMAVREGVEERVSHLAAAPEFHKGVMKTLAYIAYKQPVPQAEVIKFRNSKAYEHIKALKERGFIRKERTGRTFKIYTTKKFVQYFGDTQGKAGGATEMAKSAEGAQPEACAGNSTVAETGREGQQDAGNKE